MSFFSLNIKNQLKMNIITKTTSFLSLGEFVLQSATRSYAKVVAGGNF